MIFNYFKTAWRNLSKRKGFSLINIFGLAISITCCMLICLYIYQQLTYDTYAKNYKNIYRVELANTDNNRTSVYPRVDIAVGKGIKDAYPEVNDYTRIVSFPPMFMTYQSTQFKENLVAAVDPNFLNFFDIPFVEGDRKAALAEPYTMVLTETTAKKYFGKDNPVGKQITYGSFTNPFKITGVVKNIPSNSHFHFDVFFSSESLPNLKGNSWSNVGTLTYVSLKSATDPAKLEAKFPQLVAEHVVPEIQKDMGVTIEKARESIKSFIFKLRPLKEIHLYSKTNWELEPPGDIQYVYIFGALAIFILLLACVNFVNLATAGASSRSKEVGIRKVMGSLKKQLIFQFLSESVLIACCALLIAFFMVFLLMPWFNHLTGEQMNFSVFFGPKVLLVIIGFTLFTGLIAGFYPAFFMSSFQPIKVLKGVQGMQLSGKSFMRNSLVVFQFTVSIVLIVATLVVYKQLNYMQNKKLGYDKEQVVIVSNANSMKQNKEAFKQKLLQNKNIAGVTNSWGVPASPNMGGTQVYPKTFSDRQDRKEIHINIFKVDQDYIKVLGMEMASGRNFSRAFPADSIDGVIINQTAAHDLGWSDSGAIGNQILRSGQKIFNVVGVVKDFQYASAKDQIAPLMLLMGGGDSYLVRVNTSDVKGVLASMESDWKSFSPGVPFEYNFLDETFYKLYQSEETTGQIFSVFALIAVLIASMGLLGLISYITVSRTREIGVRKVLGASVQGIVVMLTRNFILLILISTLVAIPVSWWAMSSWLKDFNYRTSISWWLFGIAVAIALIIALVTISFQAIKAARANPVNSLRSE